MASKSGDSSLHDWFSKSKSSDGKKGWVQLGGKYAGKPCAKQPGQTTKPKCGSSKMKRDLNKDEEQAAFRRKNKKDPNPNRKGKAINVATEETMLKHESYEINPAAHKAAQKKTKMRNLARGNENPNEKAAAEKKAGGPKLVGEAKVDKKLPDYKRATARDKRYGNPYGSHALGGGIRKDRRADHEAKRGVKEEVVTEADKKGKGSGKKDACYHKVKASAKVWPSAYASGRLVQCRKKGSGNYGKSKSESYSWRDELDYVKEGAAWTKKSGKNKEGGLNEKGRKSYERENPGSDLKAPQPEGGSRKKSFCARMGGMKKKLTSSKTANDPDSRINKALRKWKC